MAKISCPIDTLPPFRDNGILNVLVETPAGSRSKMNYEPEFGLFALGKILPEGFAFPFDFGFVPGTLAEDGDPLDVMLIAETGTAPGCLVPARVLGVLEAEERSKSSDDPPRRNDRILAIPLASRQYAELGHLEQLPDALREQIEYFLTSYGGLERKELRVTAVNGPDAALEQIRQAIQKNKQRS